MLDCAQVTQRAHAIWRPQSCFCWLGLRLGQLIWAHYCCFCVSGDHDPPFRIKRLVKVKIDAAKRFLAERDLARRKHRIIPTCPKLRKIESNSIRYVGSMLLRNFTRRSLTKESAIREYEYELNYAIMQQQQQQASSCKQQDLILAVWALKWRQVAEISFNRPRSSQANVRC